MPDPVQNIIDEILRNSMRGRSEPTQKRAASPTTRSILDELWIDQKAPGEFAFLPENLTSFEKRQRALQEDAERQERLRQRFAASQGGVGIFTPEPVPLSRATQPRVNLEAETFRAREARRTFGTGATISQTEQTEFERRLRALQEDPRRQERLRQRFAASQGGVGIFTPEPVPEEAPPLRPVGETIKEAFEAPRGAFARGFGAHGLDPGLLAGGFAVAYERYIQPFTGLALTALSKLAPGKVGELESKYDELRAEGVGPIESARQAGITSPVPRFVTGALELLTPDLLLPGVGLGRPLAAGVKGTVRGTTAAAGAVGRAGAEALEKAVITRPVRVAHAMPAGKGQLPAATKLPSELAGAKPRYGFGSKKFTLAFDSDLDRAAYILAQTPKSKRDADYLKFVMDNTGMDEAAARGYGRQVREGIKTQARAAPAGELRVAASERLTQGMWAAAEVTGAKATAPTGAARTASTSASRRAARIEQHGEEAGRKISNAESERGRFARLLSSYPDQPQYLAGRGETEAFLSKYGLGDIQTAEGNIKEARHFWETEYGRPPEMEAAILRAERVLEEVTGAKATARSTNASEAARLASARAREIRARSAAAQAAPPAEAVRVEAPPAAGEVPGGGGAGGRGGVAELGGAPPPPPSFEEASGKLLRLLKGSVRRAGKETEQLRAAERSRRGGPIEAIRARTDLDPDTKLRMIRAAQRGELPASEIQFPATEFITDAEADTLGRAIYDAFPRKGQKAANTHEAFLSLIVNGKLPTRGEIIDMEQVFGREIVRELLAKRALGVKVFENFVDAINLPRSLLSSFDLSAPLRQGVVLAPANPRQWGQSFKEMVRAFGSEKYSRLIDDVTKADPDFPLAERANLYQTPFDEGARLSSREETFISRWAERIPIVGIGVRASQRAFVTFLNRLRFQVFKKTVEGWRRAGKQITDRDYETLADFLNAATGRGNVGRIEQLMPVSTALFFSPRLQISRVQTFTSLITATPEVRKIVAQNLVAFFGTGATILGLLKLGGTNVEVDLRSPFAGRVIAGTTSLDFWGGFQSIARYLTQFITDERKVLTGPNAGDITPIRGSRASTMSRFVRTKLAPFPSGIWDWLAQQNIIGEPVPSSLGKEAFDRLVPLFIQDLVEAFQEYGAPGVLIAAPGGFGVSVLTIPGQPFQEAVAAYNAIPADRLDLELGQLSQLQYRQRNPEADAALFLAGRVSSLTTPRAIQAALELIQESGRNPDDIRGISQRKERQQKAAEAGQRLEWNEVDALIRLLEESVQDAPAQESPTPIGEPQWGSGMTREMLIDALRR